MRRAKQHLIYRGATTQSPLPGRIESIAAVFTSRRLGRLRPRRRILVAS